MTDTPHGLEVLRTYGEGFAGRQAELAALDQAWNEGTRIFVLHAEGGAGKTRVIRKWLLANIGMTRTHPCRQRLSSATATTTSSTPSGF